MKLRLSAPSATLRLDGDDTQHKTVFLSGTSTEGKAVKATAVGATAVELDQVLSRLASGGLSLEHVFLELDGGWAADGNNSDVFRISEFMVLKGASLELAMLRKKAFETRTAAEKLMADGKVKEGYQTLLGFAAGIICHDLATEEWSNNKKVEKAPTTDTKQATTTTVAQAPSEKKPGGFAAFATPSNTPDPDAIELDNAELQAVADAAEKPPVKEATPRASETKAPASKVPSFGSF